MIYTKDNIDGVRFTVKGYPNITYTVDLSHKNNLSYGNSRTHVNMESIVDYLNSGDYIPVERNELYLIHN